MTYYERVVECIVQIDYGLSEVHNKRHTGNIYHRADKRKQKNQRKR